VLTILHTNDFHNHLLPHQADRLKKLRNEIGENGLLLDAGDAISSGNVTYKSGGEPILDAMSEAGYDAMTVGNREFHFSQAGFFAKLSRAAFPALCANVRAREAGAAVPVVSHIKKVLAGSFRVTVFGLTVPMITDRMLVRHASAWVFDDPITVAHRIVPEIRPDCDLLVCLSHIGLAKDRDLARDIPKIDLIIGGHTHATLPEGERIGDTLIVQAGWWGKLLGTVSVELTANGPRMKAGIEPL
jgi:2',3'-cyclic-nucleotide 2'-phosphodiesterase (5'-nucleotidase family)